jgi:hypothetical protein
MEDDITKVMAGLVRQANPDLETRLTYQAEALRETPCIDPSVGRWVDANGVPLLLSALALDDEDFAERYPAMAHLGGPERQRLAAKLEAHFDQCPHCSLKRGYDLESEARIEQTCRQNKDFLLRILEGAEAGSTDEGDHIGVEWERALSANQ